MARLLSEIAQQKSIQPPIVPANTTGLLQADFLTDSEMSEFTERHDSLMGKYQPFTPDGSTQPLIPYNLIHG